MNREDVVREYRGMETPAPGTWRVVEEASEVGLVARYMGLMRMRVRFRTFGGTVHIGEDPEGTSLEARIDAASIDTGIGILNRLLCAPRILHVERYPNMSFQSSEVVHVGGALLRIRGELTVRDVTRTVDLEVEYRGVGPGGRARFGAWSDLDRAEFIHWRELLGISRWRVGRRMRIELAIEAEHEDGPAERPARAGPPPEAGPSPS